VAVEVVAVDSPGKGLLTDYVEGENRVTAAQMQRDLTIHLADNFNHNQGRLRWLYILLMVGIGCLGLEVVCWVLAV
jgi:hypothetical protein